MLPLWVVGVDAQGIHGRDQGGWNLLKLNKVISSDIHNVPIKKQTSTKVFLMNFCE